MNGLLVPKIQREPPGRIANKIVMQNESDDSLVTYMGFYEEERATAEAAAAELYRRHSKKMTAWCIKGFLLYRQSHEELVRLTFQKALKAAKNFSLKLPKDASVEAKTKHIKFWLYCVLKNTCIDARRSERFEREARAEVDVENVAMVILDAPHDETVEPPTPRRVGLIREFIEQLQPHDQAILYNTVQYYDRRTKQTVMPKPVLDMLCSELGMTKISLRTQRSRLLERMRQYVLDNE
jgi:DNA-directed RNA polymerase specialized sigma24 family protein